MAGGVQLTCVCGASFIQTRSNQRYCTPPCQKRAKWNRADKKRKDSGATTNYCHKLKCKLCGIEFLGDRRTRQFCSNKCSAVSRKKYLNIPDCLNNPIRKIDKNIGYVRIYVPMHPEANTWGYVYEHRIIVEQTLGRRLIKDEIVHHKNGKRWDNRPENLEVMNKSDHAKLKGQRLEDLQI